MVKADNMDGIVTAVFRKLAPGQKGDCYFTGAWWCEGQMACSDTHQQVERPTSKQRDPESLSAPKNVRLVMQRGVEIESKGSEGNLCTDYCSVAKSCLILGDPMDCSTPGFTVVHHVPEFAQTHVH